MEVVQNRFDLTASADEARFLLVGEDDVHILEEVAVLADDLLARAIRDRERVERDDSAMDAELSCHGDRSTRPNPGKKLGRREVEDRARHSQRGIR